MAKTEVVTLRVSEDAKKELRRIFGESKTISDMINTCIEHYMYKVAKIESGVATIEVPMEHVSVEETEELYAIFRDLEDKLYKRIIEHSNPEDFEGLRGLEGLKLLQNTKHSVVRARYAKDIQEKRDMKHKKVDCK